MKRTKNVLMIGLALIVIGSFGCKKEKGEECDPACSPDLACYEGECYWPCDYPYNCPNQKPHCQLIGDEEVVEHNGKRYNGICVGPEEVPCVPSGDEVCDGRDNDCDGSVDEGDVCPSTEWRCEPGSEIGCTTGMPGICSVGRSRCYIDASGYGPCEPINSADEADECGDRIDQNCDGRPDENCECEPGEEVPCPTGYPGVCSDGHAFCLADGSGSGSVRPLPDHRSRSATAWTTTATESRTRKSAPATRQWT